MTRKGRRFLLQVNRTNTYYAAYFWKPFPTGNQPRVGRFYCPVQGAIRNCQYFKDQVTPMLFRKHIVSMRTLLQLTIALVFFVGGVGAALAAGSSGVAPELVPYVVNALAGNVQPPTPTSTATAGYGGEGKPGLSATFNSPAVIAVDSVGNIYIADTSSAIIRELNATTGIVNTIAGVPPSGCGTGTTCSKTTLGCSDGVPALNDPIGGNIKGMAVDANGNIYFVDASQVAVSVIFHAGTRVADFITREDPAGVALSKGVVPGYIYHVGGTINLTSCVGTKSNLDNALAFQGATLNTTGQMGLDSAGNIYIQDIGNSSMRVINTQETTQQFFQYSVPAGFMKAIVNCSASLTVACQSIVTPTSGTGIDGTASQATYNILTGMGVDAYGNVYEVNNKGATPGIYAGVAYAGGAALAKLLNLEWPLLNSTAPGESDLLPSGAANLDARGAIYGDWYEVVNDISLNTTLPSYFQGVGANSTGGGGGAVIRPTAINADPLGNVYFLDNHYPELFRVDANSQIMTDIIGWGGSNGGTKQQRTGTDTTGKYASTTNPEYCIIGIAGTPFTSGPQTTDDRADGCPAILGETSANGSLAFDGVGDIFNNDTSYNEIREFPAGTAFPATALGSKVTQGIQVHFDSTNLPVSTGQAPNVITSSFSIATGIPDFTIDTTDPSFQMGLTVQTVWFTPGTSTSITNSTEALYAGPPSCSGLAAAFGDPSIDCLVYVSFKPTAAGLRESQLVVTTANGSIYNFALTGIGSGGQLAIDGGQATTIAATGLGATSAVAVDTNGKSYIADAANNRIVVCTPGSGSLCATQTVLAPTIGGTATVLKGPKGIALDAANNIFISDTGNNRILEVNPYTSVATVLGGIDFTSCNPPVGGVAAATNPCPTPTPANTTVGAGFSVPVPAPGTSVPAYTFNAPQGLAVDIHENVYVADTGNAAIVEIPSNPVLGGATPMFQYAGAPTFVNPVGVAVDPKGNIYVADTGNPFQQVVEIPPGGGDMHTLLPLGSALTPIGGQNITTPNGVAVDSAGNVYISDSGANVIWEAPAAGPPNGNPFILNFTGLSSPAGLALDSNGNLYVADSGNKQILYSARQNPSVSFGTVPQSLGVASGVAGSPSGCLLNGSSTPCTGILTVTNTGNLPVPLSEPITSVTSATPAATGDIVLTDSCGSTSTLLPGATCTITPTFTPHSDGSQKENILVNGTNSVSLMGNVSGVGEQPLVNIGLTATYSGGVPAAGSTATIKATVTQLHIPPGAIPTGTVTFSYVIDPQYAPSTSCGTGGTQTVALSGGSASWTLPGTLAQGRTYVVSATYNGDSFNSLTAAAPLQFIVPGIPVTATAASLSYTYGTTVPTITGSITGVDSSVTATLISGASQFSPVSGSPYPVTVTFAGGDFCNYASPQVNNPSTTTQAVVTESPAPLTATLPAFTSLYGAPDLNYALQLVLKGAVNGDQNKISATFIPPHSSILTVAGSPYTVTPTLTGKPISPFKDYNVTYASGSLTITQAPSQISPALAKTSALPTGLSAATVVLNVTTAVAGGIGLPTGTITIYDTLTPITTTAPGLATIVPACTLPFTGAITSGSSTVTVSSGFGLTVGEAISGAGIPSGTTISAVGTATVTLSANATATSGFVLITATASTPCNTPFTGTLVNGAYTFTPTNTALGLHQFSYLYSGDSNFLPVTLSPPTPGPAALPCAPAALVANCLLVDNGDFVLTSTTGVLPIVPGVTPSGNGLLAAPGQNSTYPESAGIVVNSLLSETGVISLSCLPIGNPVASTFTATTTSGSAVLSGVSNTSGFTVGESISGPGIPSGATVIGITTSTITISANATATATGATITTLVPPPANAGTASSYIQCTMTPPAVTLSSGGTQTSVLSVSTPATEPLNYKFFTAKVGMPGSETVLAFLPLGVLAFCLRRRRRLSKALWMLLAIAAVTAGMSGCGGNLVDLFSPIPQGPQYIQITATGTSITAPNAPLTRTFLVQIYID
jgi:sugar lactone lactonase YvrE